VKILITGSSGFVGLALIKALKSSDHSVNTIDVRQNGDLRDRNVVKKIPRFDIVYHLAGKVGIAESLTNSFEFYSTNIYSTHNILELCERYSAKMVYISSYIYGNPQYLPIDERHPVNPQNPYSYSKYIGEILCKSFSENHAVRSIIVRPFNIYGPNQASTFLIPTIISQIKTGTISLKDPNPKRDFLYIDDFIKALLAFIENEPKENEIFNLGSGTSLSVRSVVNIVKKYSKSSFDVIYKNNYRHNVVTDCVADITKAKSLLKWSPSISMDTGLKSLLS